MIQMCCFKQSTCKGGSRISQTVGTIYYLAKFLRKLHENGENWTGARPLIYYADPPLPWKEHVREKVRMRGEVWALPIQRSGLFEIGFHLMEVTFLVLVEDGFTVKVM